MEGLSKEIRLKFVLVGDSGTGKSSVLRRFVDDTFSPSFMTTIGIDFKVKEIKVNDTMVKVQVWDTAGQERFKTITNAYYNGADAILVVYSVTDKDSFNHLSYWIDEVDKRARTDAIVVIVGNKCDEAEARCVAKEDAQDYATKRAYGFWETSAKDGSHVNELFMSVAEGVFKSKGFEKGVQHNPQQPIILKSQDDVIIKKKGCCYFFIDSIISIRHLMSAPASAYIAPS